MILSQAIKEFNFSSLNRRLQKRTRLQLAVEMVERKADGLEVPVDLEAFDYERAILDLSNGNASRRQIKRLATGGLSLLEERDNHSELLDTLLSAIDILGRGLLKSLLIGYLLAPNPDSLVTKPIRRFLKKRQDRLPALWRERIHKYRLLSAEVGVHCSGLILNSINFDSESFASDSGMKGVKGSGGVAYQIFQSLSNTLAQDHSGDNLRRYLDFVTMDKSIRFPSHINDYANALLSPYVDFPPDDENRATIEEFMIEKFGDPRIKPDAWRSVPDEQTVVMKQWLAKASLELLLNIVSESNDTRQWEERSKFWGHYFDQGLVTDAWVVLGPAAKHVARRLVRDGVISSASNYGVLDGGGVQSDHSVLILRLGDFVISEWTHSGKVRIYDINNRHSPHFYQRRYNTLNIRSDATCNVAQVHHASWKGLVAGFLSYELGIAPLRGITPIKETASCSSCRQQLNKLWFTNHYPQKCTRCSLKSNYV